MNAGRRLVSIVVALAMTVGAGLAVAGPAEAAASYTVEGRAYLGSSIHPAGAGEVRVRYAPEGASFTDDQSVLTDASGAFSIAGLAGGTWELELQDLTSTDYRTTNVEVTPSTDPTKITVVLHRLVSIFGTVYLGDESHPAGAGEAIVTATQLGSDVVDGTGTTDASGHYAIKVPGGGAEILQFASADGSFTTTWWNGAYSASTAERFNVPSFDDIEANQVLLAGAAMHGAIDVSRLPDSFDRSRIEVTVVAHLLNADGTDRATISSGPVWSGTDWRYSFPSIPAGNYRIQFTSQWGIIQRWLDSSVFEPGGRTVSLAQSSDVDLGTERMLAGAQIEARFTCSGCGALSKLQTQLEAQHPDGSWSVVPPRPGSNPVASGQILYWALLPGTYRITVLGMPALSCGGTGAGPAVQPDDGPVTPGGTFAVACFDPLQHVFDFSGDHTPDVLAITSKGALIDYDANGMFGWKGVSTIGSGWTSIDLATTAPGLGPGSAPLLARRRGGLLYLYQGDRGGFRTVTLIGTGWSHMTRIMSDGDFTGDGHADVLATDAAGALWVYPGDATGHLGARRKIGTGWSHFTSVVPVGDFDHDGHADLLARTAKGALLLYRGTGSGGWLPTRTVGSGWNQFSAILSAGDYTGDTRVDVMARDALGRLWLYPTDGAGHFTSDHYIIGTGWNGLRLPQ